VVHAAPMPALVEFVAAAARHGVRVALSSWYREDRTNARMAIRTPEDLGAAWVATLRHLDDAGLLDQVLYVDLCNEFPMAPSAPWLYGDHVLRALVRRQPPAADLDALVGPQLSRTSSEAVGWMARSIALVRAAYPDLDYTFSFCDELVTWRDQDVSMLDVLEPHIWMSSNELSDFDERVGYGYQGFDPAGYDALVAHARTVYEGDRERYDDALFRTIDAAADWSRASGRALYTTECWAVTDWKDWPGLDWDWILDVNERAVERVVTTGRWVGIATSNHCGPQFAGTWREVAWHQRLTGLIRSAPVDAELRERTG
ncbi:MAG: cellulase-like family protein, partial [Nocardioides sp.]